MHSGQIGFVMNTVYTTVTSSGSHDGDRHKGSVLYLTAVVSGIGILILAYTYTAGMCGLFHGECYNISVTEYFLDCR